ncbi:BnaC06g03260D [Brassica napus]|uniref:BnaC06g03260D protein n=1 Tax=Brassica napus TaxID=3708 RepID=A0A078GNN6_BRANA|nr:BnaC06g03260D [Brassica napus]
MIWRRRLSKSPTSLRFSISTRPNKYDVVDNNLNSVFARVRSITNQYKGLIWDQTRIHQHQLLYMLMPLLLSSQQKYEIVKKEPILVSMLLPLQMLHEALLIFISPSLDSVLSVGRLNNSSYFPKNDELYSQFSITIHIVESNQPCMYF